MEFYRRAYELNIKIPQAIMNEKIVPKRWRMWFAPSFNDLLDKLMGYIIAANNVYPYNDDLCAERKRYQQYAIDTLDRIDDKIQQLVDLLFPNNIDADHHLPFALLEIGELIDKEHDLLKGWKSHTKVYSRK